MATIDKPISVSLLATPEVDASALAGLHGVLTAFAHIVPDSVRFNAVVAVPDSVLARLDPTASVLENVMGMPLPAQQPLSGIGHTDVLIIPSLYLLAPDWSPNPYPDLTDWIIEQHRQGALICSACTGAMLLAETGLLDGYEATQHWAFEQLFRRHFPKVRLNVDKVLITTGASGRILMSGASAAWHDLLIHLVSRYAGLQAAQTVAKFFLLNVHSEGQAPYVIFREQRQHGDGPILAAQDWLREHSTRPHPVELAQQASGLQPRTFSRRFRKATGLTPIDYVQRLRIEGAKQRLERGGTPVDEISWQVGYEDPAFFRRLFKRITGMTPKRYRRKFQLRGMHGYGE